MVKKKEIYPIPCQFKKDSASFSAPITGLNHVGLVCSIGAVLMRPGENYSASFEFPLINRFVEIQVTVVRIVDKIISGVLENGKPKLERVAELQYRNPNPEFKKLISSFMLSLSSL